MMQTRLASAKLSIKMLVNLILSCHHILYAIDFDAANHLVGEQHWCPNCGLVGITEIEGPYMEGM